VSDVLIQSPFLVRIHTAINAALFLRIIVLFYCEDELLKIFDPGQVWILFLFVPHRPNFPRLEIVVEGLDVLSNMFSFSQAGA